MVHISTRQILKKLGNDVYFLYVEERTMSRGNTKEFDKMFKITKEYWGNKFLHYRVPILEKVWFNVNKRNAFMLILIRDKSVTRIIL